jgi:hypothetical protein
VHDDGAELRREPRGERRLAGTARAVDRDDAGRDAGRQRRAPDVVG